MGEELVKKLSVRELLSKKHLKEPISWLTCYDFSFATALNETSLDLILVGDSGGMVSLGYKNTNPVSLDEMIILSSAVRRGAPGKFIVGDMPKGTYEISPEEAIRSAMRFSKEADCDAVKLEGGLQMTKQVKAISESGIPVFGHIGLTPQSANSFGGYRIVGRSDLERQKLFDDAMALRDAGAVAILVEATPDGLASEIAKNIDIPIYGIGAGAGVDGQLLIFHDLLGIYPIFRPKFAPCLVPKVLRKFEESLKQHVDLMEYGRTTRRDGFWEITRLAVEEFVNEVKSGSYPSQENVYK
jgi:3-methyl-2-oxobutanoate hydroxymethyltransferase